MSEERVKAQHDEEKARVLENKLVMKKIEAESKKEAEKVINKLYGRFYKDALDKGIGCVVKEAIAKKKAEKVKNRVKRLENKK